MKRKLYNTIVFFFFVANVFAQKTDKKYSEKFYTSSDVEIEINASNADVEVQNWNKNEVSVEASIEVEGVTKEEAKKYIDKWNFEALGNKSKVKINANGSGRFSFGNDDFVLFNNHYKKISPKLVTGFAVSKDGKIIKNLENLSNGIGTIFLDDFEEFHFPQVQSEILFSDIDKLIFDFDKYAKEGDNYFFQWKDDAKNIKIKSKKEWGKFKKTKEYKKLKKELKEKRNKLSREEKKELLTLRKNALQQKKVLERKRKIAILKKRKKELELYKSARKELEKKLESSNERKRKKIEAQIKMQNLAIGLLSPESDGKKVKIKKKIVIKAPKKAVIKLNTRHSKVKLPNSKVSGRVNYGTFNAENINGGELTVHSSPVTINDLNNCELYLRNVQPAILKTISNTNLVMSSSNLTINDVKKNVVIEDSFSNLDIKNVSSNFDKFFLDLNSSTANIKFADLKKRLNANFKKSGFSFPSSKPNMIYKDDGISATGNFKITTDDNSVNIKGKYSKVNVKN